MAKVLMVVKTEKMINLILVTLPVDIKFYMHYYLVHEGYMVWQVRLSKKLEKKSKALPPLVQVLLFQLMREIAILGPVRGNWPIIQN
jgi:hypothetical protein